MLDSHRNKTENQFSVSDLPRYHKTTTLFRVSFRPFTILPEQTGQECWLCASDSSGISGEEDAAYTAERHGEHLVSPPGPASQTAEHFR